MDVRIGIAVVFVASLALLLGHAARVGWRALGSRRLNGSVPARGDTGHDREIPPRRGAEETVERERNGGKKTADGARATSPTRVIAEAKPATKVRTS